MSSSTSSSEPLRLLVRASLGAFLMAPLLWWGHRHGEHVARIDYHGAVAAKQARLESLASPKVIVMGGSNAAFGIDSERLEQALCMPVVNMAIHASLGVEYMVNEVKAHIGRGDVVIASFEHPLYNKAIMDNEVHVMTVDRAPQALAFVPWYRRPRIHLALAIMRIQATWKYATGEWDEEVADKVYRADGFNERGDMVAHLGLPQRGPDRQHGVDLLHPYFGTDILPLIRELSDSVHVHQAVLIITWPCIAASSRRSEVDAAIVQRMAEEGYPLLGAPQNYIFPDTAFHDTHYHLRATGRRLRTQQLIRDLCGSGKVRCCTK